MDESIKLSWGKKNRTTFVLGIALITFALANRATGGIQDVMGIPLLNYGVVVLISSFAIEFLRLYRHSPIKKELILN